MELVVLMGVPGSGKSTFYRSCFAATHVQVSKDLFRNNRNKARRQQQLLEEAMAAGRSVVLDNTNPTLADRAAPIALARAYGAAVSGYVFPRDIAGALERNRGRAGKARVPDIAIYATAQRWQSPTLNEGFDRLFWVRFTSEGHFDVSPYGDHEQGSPDE